MNDEVVRGLDAKAVVKKFKGVVHCIAPCSKSDTCGYAKLPYSSARTFDIGIQLDGCINYIDGYVTR